MELMIILKSFKTINILMSNPLQKFLINEEKVLIESFIFFKKENGYQVFHYTMSYKFFVKRIFTVVINFIKSSYIFWPKIFPYISYNIICENLKRLCTAIVFQKRE